MNPAQPNENVNIPVLSPITQSTMIRIESLDENDGFVLKHSETSHSQFSDGDESGMATTMSQPMDLDVADVPVARFANNDTMVMSISDIETGLNVWEDVNGIDFGVLKTAEIDISIDLNVTSVYWATVQSQESSRQLEAQISILFNKEVLENILYNALGIPLSNNEFRGKLDLDLKKSLALALLTFRKTVYPSIVNDWSEATDANAQRLSLSNMIDASQFTSHGLELRSIAQSMQDIGCYLKEEGCGPPLTHTSRRILREEFEYMTNEGWTWDRRTARLRNWLSRTPPN